MKTIVLAVVMLAAPAVSFAICADDVFGRSSHDPLEGLSGKAREIARTEWSLAMVQGALGRRQDLFQAAIAKTDRPTTGMTMTAEQLRIELAYAHRYSLKTVEPLKEAIDHRERIDELKAAVAEKQAKLAADKK